MDFFSLLFRKSPLFRAFTIVFLVSILTVLSTFVSKKTSKLPTLESISPEIASAGDILTINGANFGASRNSSFIEIGGTRISSANYISWQEKKIEILLPSNIQDGQIFVQTSEGKSNSIFFANEAAIPVKVPPDSYSSLPNIFQIVPKKAFPGEAITIFGKNFGSARGNSAVCFTANRTEINQSVKNANSIETQTFSDFSTVEALEENFDYEYWSDSEIRVRVPCGTKSGDLFVVTEKGKSSAFKIEIDLNLGEKKYSRSTTYLLQTSADIALNSGAKSSLLLTVRFPRPLKTGRQPYCELTATYPEPIIANYFGAVIYQGELGRAAAKKLRFSQDFVVSVYETQTQIDESRVKPFSEKSRALFVNGTKSDELVPAKNAEVLALAKNIVGKETNPFKQSRLVYNYFIENFSLERNIRMGEATPLDLIEKKSGDAYDFAILFSAILRALSIPCQPIAGILIDSELVSQCHWWAEFYIEKFGWIPVDVAMGAGMDFNSFRTIEDKKSFYFGNLDAQHIAFSRGWNKIKTNAPNGKIVYRPRTYAFQSVWEEASGSPLDYNSLWNNPIIVGVY